MIFFLLFDILKFFHAFNLTLESILLIDDVENLKDYNFYTSKYFNIVLAIKQFIIH